MSGYDNSPDYGGPEPSWREAAVILTIVAAFAAGIWALRHTLLCMRLAW